MSLTLVTGPAIEPVTVAEAKAHFRVDVTDDDALIDSLIRAAREHAETFTHRSFLTQTWDLKLDAFPCGDDLWLPKPPVSSVTSVTYTDTAGSAQTWTAGATGYLTDLPSGPQARAGRIYPAYALSYPSTRCVPNAVTVRFVAGYGATREAVPDSIRAAIKIWAKHWYDEGRSLVQIGNLVTPIPTTAAALLWPFKSF